MRNCWVSLKDGEKSFQDPWVIKWVFVHLYMQSSCIWIIMLMVPNDRLLEKLKLMNLIIWRKSHHSRFQILENLKISLLSQFRECLNWKLNSHCKFYLWKFREKTISLADLKLWRRENVWKVTSDDSTVILRSYLGHAFIINHEYFHKAY